MLEAITPVLDTIPMLTDTRLAVCNVVISGCERKGDISCEVNGKIINPMIFSLDLVQRLFPRGSVVLFDVPKGRFDLPEGRVEEHYKKTSEGKSRPAGGGIKVRVHNPAKRYAEVKSYRVYSDRLTYNGNPNRIVKPRAELFEINVTKNLFTYILAFPNGSFMCTPLRKRVDPRSAY